VISRPKKEKSSHDVQAERLRSERIRLGLGQAEFADLLGVSKTSQFYYESGERSPDGEYFCKAHLHQVDTHYVITGQRVGVIDDEFVVIPRHDVTASAGAGVTNEHELQVKGLCFRRSWLTKRNLQAGNLRVIDISGDSMAGKLSDGDQVLIDMSQTTPKSGFAYVLRQGSELLVKYVQLRPDGVLRVTSENQAYEPYDIDLSKTEDVLVLGRVVASTHEW
jgi:phage repressor protein C with HTH and peptisase S24 domain